MQSSATKRPRRGGSKDVVEAHQCAMTVISFGVVWFQTHAAAKVRFFSEAAPHLTKLKKC